MTSLLTTEAAGALWPQDAGAPLRSVAIPHLLLAHGAGAPMDSAFLETVSMEVVAQGLTVHRFEFAYMAERRVSGRRRPPPKVGLLEPEFLAAIEVCRSQLPSSARLFIGGKSMGGRIATLIADRLFTAGVIAGCICLGYPFHPQGQPERLRIEHLSNYRCPTLIAQGERDPFGARDAVEAQVGQGRIAASIRLVWIGDGDHEFGPRARSGFTRRGNLAQVAAAIGAFVHGGSIAQLRA
ncbi:MAG: alpha/beta family hydrolase [Hyphomicrobiaceae bacterium]